MKKLILVILALSITSCGIVPDLTPGVTTVAYNKALKVCKGDVYMVTQTYGINSDYDAYCGDGTKHQL